MSENVKNPKRASKKELAGAGIKRKTVLVPLKESIKLEVEAAKRQTSESVVVTDLIRENL